MQQITTQNPHSAQMEEIREYFTNLPSESIWEYEWQVTTLVTSKKQAVLEEPLEILLQDADDSVAFAAYCALCTMRRRNKDTRKYEELCAQHSLRFRGHDFSYHIDLLYSVDNFDYSEAEEILTRAKENADRMPRHVGAQNLLADLVATAFEQAEESEFTPPDMDWLKVGEEAMRTALSIKNDYAKFYCTKARLKAIRGEYDKAVSLIKKAVDMENSKNDDYALRINEYLNHMQRILIKKQNQHMADRMEHYFQTIDAQQEDIRQKNKQVMDELEHSMAKNLEFIGLFAGIISFTIGSISISGSLAGISFAGAAGLIIVLLGALLCVFAGFGVMLHGFENGKSKRNLVVFLLGILAAIIGLRICFLIPPM